MTNSAKIIRDVGILPACLVAVGWAFVEFSLKPQTKLIEVLTNSTENMSASYEKLAEAVDTSTAEVVKTNEKMDAAFSLMEDVPEMRLQELSILQETHDCLVKFTDGVRDDHGTQSDEHREIIEAIKKP